MAINFPDSPALNALFTSGNTTWQYDGVKWNIVSGGATGPTGPSDYMLLSTLYR